MCGWRFIFPFLKILTENTITKRNETPANGDETETKTHPRWGPPHSWGPPGRGGRRRSRAVPRPWRWSSCPPAAASRSSSGPSTAAAFRRRSSPTARETPRCSRRGGGLREGREGGGSVWDALDLGFYFVGFYVRDSACVCFCFMGCCLWFCCGVWCSVYGSAMGYGGFVLGSAIGYRVQFTAFCLWDSVELCHGVWDSVVGLY